MFKVNIGKHYWQKRICRQIIFHGQFCNKILLSNLHTQVENYLIYSTSTIHCWMGVNKVKNSINCWRAGKKGIEDQGLAAFDSLSWGGLKSVSNEFNQMRCLCLIERLIHYDWLLMNL